MGRKRNIEPIMKPLAIAALVALGALSLHAGDQTTTATAAPQAQPQPDSPLVRAAKASGRTTTSKKKKIVITNDTLSKSGGHISTSQSTPAPLPPPPPAPNPLEKMANQQIIHRQAAQAKAKKEADAKK